MRHRGGRRRAASDDRRRRLQPPHLSPLRGARSGDRPGPGRGRWKLAEIPPAGARPSAGGRPLLPRHRGRPGVNGVHDLGGQHGHGPIDVEKDEPVFHAAWEGRVYALMALARRRRLFNLDEMRRTIEGMPPADYLRSTYYERWLAALEQLVEEKTGSAAQEPPDSLAPPPPAPRFKGRDKVRAPTRHPSAHTRLPRYARGK